MLKAFIADAFLEFVDRWQQPETAEDAAGAGVWKPYVRSFAWGKTAPGVWMECWANLHRAQPPNATSWAKFTYIKAHQHSFPFQGYVTLNGEPSNTTFRSPFTHELFSLQGQNGRLQLFPGGVRHTTSPWHGEEPRVTLAFNVDLAPPGTRVYCQIPMTLDYCQRQQASRVNWVDLLGAPRVAALQAREASALDVEHHAVSELYRGSLAEGHI